LNAHVKILSFNHTCKTAGFMDQACSGQFSYKVPVEPRADDTVSTRYRDLAFDEYSPWRVRPTSTLYVPGHNDLATMEPSLPAFRFCHRRHLRMSSFFMIGGNDHASGLVSPTPEVQHPCPQPPLLTRTSSLEQECKMLTSDRESSSIPLRSLQQHPQRHQERSN